MNYQKLYDSIMATGRQRGCKRRRGFDLHHSVPTFMGGADEDWNKVLLTPRAHYLAHRLLTKIHPNSKSAHDTVWMMSNVNGTYRVSSRAYEAARDRFANDLSARNRKLVETGDHWWQTEEARQAVSERNQRSLEAGTHPFQTEAVKLKSADSITSSNTLQVICPHCSKTGGSNGMLNWHFDACKSHPSNKGLTRDQIRHRLSKPEKKKLSIITCPHCLLEGKGQGMKRYHFDNCLQHPDNLGLTRQQIKAKRNGM